MGVDVLAGAACIILLCLFVGGVCAILVWREPVQVCFRCKTVTVGIRCHACNFPEDESDD